MNVNILDYGALSNTETVCTEAIQSAIDACAASGGGRVTIPAGVFVSGTIWLKSNIELHLEHGAKLIASQNQEDYNSEDAYEQNYGCAREEWKGQHLILIVEKEHVAITGTGIIDGSGESFFGEPRRFSASYWVQGYAMAKDKEKLRPGQLICFVECTNVKVENVTLQNNPCWGLFLHGCENVQVHGIKVINPPYFANTDGIDIDTCKKVTVSDCIIDTGDDGIAIRCDAKCLKKTDGICEHINISNCFLASSACGIRVGVGKGKIRHVRIHNLTVQRAGALFGFMSGFNSNGYAEISDISIQNVSAERINHAFDITDGSVAGIHHLTFADMRIETNYDTAISTEKQGSISDITFRNVCLEVKGKPLEGGSQSIIHCNGVENLLFERIQIQGEQEILDSWNRDIEFNNCTEAQIHRCKYREERERT